MFFFSEELNMTILWIWQTSEWMWLDNFQKCLSTLIIILDVANLNYNVFSATWLICNLIFFAEHIIRGLQSWESGTQSNRRIYVVPTPTWNAIWEIPNLDMINNARNRLLTKEGSGISMFIPKQLAKVRFKNRYQNSWRVK